MSLTKETIIKIILLIIIAGAIYINSLGGDFVWDDTSLVAGNREYFEDVVNLTQVFHKPYFEVPYYRPFLLTSFFLDYSIWGLNPYGFHLSNVVLHILNTLLVFGLISQLGYSSGISFFTAALFAAHPVQTEAIAWIAGRNDSLMVFFFLITFIGIGKGRRPQRVSRKTYWYIISFASFGCAFLTKEMAVMFLPLLMLADFFYHRRVWGSSARKETIAVYGVCAAITLGFMFFRSLILSEFPTRLSFIPENLSTAITTPLSVYTYYFKVLFFPFNLTVAPSFSFSGTAIHSTAFIFGVFFISIAGAAVVMKNVFKEGLFGILWVIIYILPVSGIVHTGVTILEHRLYGASIGFCLMLTVACQRLSSSILKNSSLYRRYGWQGILMLIVAAYACITMERNNIWKDDVSVWSDTLEKAPDSLGALNNLGHALIKKGKYDLAITHLNRAVAINPKAEKAHGNMGFAFYGKKDYQKALSAFKKVLQLNPRSAETYNNIGMVSRDTRDYKTAFASFQKSIEINPKFAQAYINRAKLYMVQGEKIKAIADYQAALKLAPHNRSILNALGLYYVDMGQSDRAFEYYRRALNIDPANYEALNNSALLYIRLRDYEKAYPFLEKAIASNPDFPEPHLNLGIIFFNTGKINEAIGEYTKALSLNPDYIEAHFNIATALLLMPDKKEQALYHFKKVLILKPDYKQKDLIEKTIAAISTQSK
jgi:tetratricopeptide (TPR) repeat protein